MSALVKELISPMSFYEDLVREQRLQVCELALRALEEHDESMLRWFTTEILHFSKAWTHIVCLALFDKSKTGELRWRVARNPLGLVRDIAWRTALSWNPDLIFGNRASWARSGGRELLMTDAVAAVLARHSDSGNSYQDAVDLLSYASDDTYYYDAYTELQDQLDDAVYLKSDQAIVVSEGGEDDEECHIIRLQYDWDEIGRRIGLDESQTLVMKARASGITRAEMGKHLGWLDHTVQAVWRSIHRYLSDPGVRDSVRSALLRSRDD
jgi:hypothetical protein